MSTIDSSTNKIDGLPGDHPAKLEELYHEEGLTQREVAERFDCAPSTVHRAMVDHSIERREWYKDHAPLIHTPTGHSHWNGPIKKDGRRNKVPVHQLVAIADGADPAEVFGDGMHTHHKNGVPWDNRPSNLEVLTSSEHKSLHLEEKLSDKPWRDKVLLERLHVDEGMSPSELAEQMDCSWSTVARWLQEYDLYQDPNSVKESPWRDRQTLVNLYWGEEMGVVEVGEELGCSPTTVTRWLHNHDIETRQRGGAHDV